MALLNQAETRLPLVLDSPRATAAQWLLRLAIAGLCGGMAAAIFLEMGTSLGNVAFMEWGVDDARVVAAERWAAWLLLAAGASVLLWPMSPVLLLVAAVMLVDSWAGHRFGGYAFFEWTIPTQVLRFAAPLALIPLVLSLRFAPAGRWRLHASAWVLRLGLAVLFLFHGLEAWRLHPGFIDMIIGTSRGLMDSAVSESTAGSILRLIAVVDIILAGLVLVRPWKAVLFWMAFWAAVTAGARMTALGWGVYFEFLLRLVHVAAPLAVWLLVGALRQDRAAIALAPSADQPHQKQQTPPSADTQGVATTGHRH